MPSFTPCRLRARRAERCVHRPGRTPSLGHSAAHRARQKLWPTTQLEYHMIYREWLTIVRATDDVAQPVDEDKSDRPAAPQQVCPGSQQVFKPGGKPARAFCAGPCLL
jgi:hypothetical protein